MAATRDSSDHSGFLPTVLGPGPVRGERTDGGGVRRSTRDWRVDFATVGLALTAGTALLDDSVERNAIPDWLIVVDAVLGTILCLALWWRRRWPVAVAALAVPVSAVSEMGSLAALIALFSLAVHRSFGIVALVTVAGISMLPLYLTLHPAHDVPYWFLMALAIALIVATVAWGSFVRARRQLIMSLRGRAERAEAEQQLRVEQARLEERARIAREMHDVLGHRISLLSLHAGALEFRSDAAPQEVSRAAGVIRASAHQALEDLRQVIGVLRGESGARAVPESPQPTLGDLPALVEESRRAGTPVNADYRLDLDAVPESAGRNAYRIVQEGLTNARKHAPGTPVALCVDGSAGAGLSLTLRNRLPLRPEPTRIPGSGRGLVGLIERASLAGGRLEHGHTGDGEFQLSAWLPWLS